MTQEIMVKERSIYAFSEIVFPLESVYNLITLAGPSFGKTNAIVFFWAGRVSIGFGDLVSLGGVI
jgi:hypothetical protein